MVFEKISNISLTDLFVEQIENKILSGELAIGDKLPSARELTTLLGVSRPVISAGLIELEKKGFIEVHPRQGAYVCDYRRKGTMETLVAIMRYNGGAMRKNEVEALLQVRRSLESLCMELVVEHAGEEELHGILPFLENIRSCKKANLAEAIFTFHHELAVLSGNVLLPLLYHSFKPQSIYLWDISSEIDSQEGTYKTKKELYEALLQKDKEKALALTNESVNQALKELEPYIA